MTQRMSVAEIAPEGYQAVLRLDQYVRKAVDPGVLELVKLRASMLNGCAFCVDLHSRDALVHGESERRLPAGFLTAVRTGDLAALTALLHEDVVLWSDGGGKARAARRPVYGPDRVARFCLGVRRRLGRTGRVAQRWLNGAPGLVVTTPDTRIVLLARPHRGRISDLYLITNPDKLQAVTDDRIRPVV